MAPPPAPAAPPARSKTTTTRNVSPGALAAVKAAQQPPAPPPKPPADPQTEAPRTPAALQPPAAKQRSTSNAGDRIGMALRVARVGRRVRFRTRTIASVCPAPLAPDLDPAAGARVLGVLRCQLRARRPRARRLPRRRRMMGGSRMIVRSFEGGEGGTWSFVGLICRVIISFTFLYMLFQASMIEPGCSMIQWTSICSFTRSPSHIRCPLWLLCSCQYLQWGVFVHFEYETRANDKRFARSRRLPLTRCAKGSKPLLSTIEWDYSSRDEWRQHDNGNLLSETFMTFVALIFLSIYHLPPPPFTTVLLRIRA